MYIHRVIEGSLKLQLADRKVIILLGARQVGKTTLIEPFVQNRNGVLLNCDIAIDKAKILAAATLPPTEAMKLLGSPSLLVVDEAQNLPEIGKIVKGWYDAHVTTKV